MILQRISCWTTISRRRYSYTIIRLLAALGFLPFCIAEISVGKAVGFDQYVDPSAHLVVLN